MFEDSAVAAPENAFWDFSLSMYEDSAIREACHRFQDTDSANVNLVLFSYWLGYAVKALSHEEFSKACETVVDWHQEVTKTLRKARVYLKKAGDNEWVKNYYGQVLTTEILSESYQQELLYNQVKQHMKDKPTQNKALSRQYLLWLFHDLRQEIHAALKDRIGHFVAMVSNKLDEVAKQAQA